MIEVQGLSKHYGGRPAIVDLAFTVARGQALGLVGPAGSGKSTALRLLAGVLSPTSGSVVIAGHEGPAGSRRARRRLGYLPAGAPLDDEMRVEPFLRTMCRLRGVPPWLRRERIDWTLERCGLDEERRALIGRLPGGARLRLGLAQAVVHDPDVLVLDEPGEATGLVAAVGRDRAVVVSGRSVADVGGVCGRVLVLEAGRVVADETPAGQQAARRRQEVVVVVRGDGAAAERHVRLLRGVSVVTVEEVGGGAHRLTVTGEDGDLEDAVARVIVHHGIGLKELSTRRPGTGGAP